MLDRVHTLYKLIKPIVKKSAGLNGQHRASSWPVVEMMTPFISGTDHQSGFTGLWNTPFLLKHWHGAFSRATYWPPMEVMGTSSSSTLTVVLSKYSVDLNSLHYPMEQKRA
ncbi:hypothetical protein ACS0TY_000282 [Phlomoides rotata]